MQIFFLAPNARAISAPCSWVLVGVQVLSFLRWSSIAAILSMHILQALTMLPLQALPFYKGKLEAGIDLPSRVYAIAFFSAFMPIAIVHFFRLALMTDWFHSDYLCRRYADCTKVSILDECLARNLPCVYTLPEKLLTGLYIALVCIVLLVYFGMVIFSRNALRKMSYKEHRISCVELGFQVRNLIT